MKPIFMDFPMPIITKRLFIRPPKLGDGKIINSAVLETFEDLKATMPWAKSKPTLEESEEFVRQAVANWILKTNEEPYLPLFIFKSDDKQFIGASGYHHIDWDIPSYEIGYWTRRSCQQQGFMTETVNALTRYAFLELHAKRVQITCDVLNFRSKKIPERLSYDWEASLKNHRINPVDGSISDTLIYAKYDLKNMPELAVNWKSREI